MRISRRLLTRAAVGAAGVLLVALALRPDVRDVDAIVVQPAPFQVTIDEAGQTRVRRHAVIMAPITGRLAESRLRAGDTVTAGTVVARLSPAPLDPRARDQAEAAWHAASALKREAGARVEQSRIALDESRRARERAERLLATGGIAPRELEQAVADERVRARELDAAAARLGAAEQEESAAQSALRGADPSAVAGVAPVPLRSPMSGIVLRVLQEHDRVVPAGTPLLEIGDPATIEVVVDILSRDAGLVAPGTPMRVSIGGAAPLAARVDRVEPAAYTKVSPLGVAEQRVDVIGRFAEIPPALGDGFEVDVAIVLWEHPAVLQVPATALVPVDAGWGVFVIRRGAAGLQVVSTGRRGSRDVEVKSGVHPGDSVVAFPDDRLRSGEKVRARIREPAP
jgi:HlyD family secretion protein